MPRGRKPESVIRQNIVEILYFMKKAHGYEVYRIYKAVFPLVTMRSIYYHLKKGFLLEEFKIAEIKKEMGDFSWGNYAEKIYYELGRNAKPVGNLAVKNYLDKMKSKN